MLVSVDQRFFQGQPQPKCVFLRKTGSSHCRSRDGANDVFDVRSGLHTFFLPQANLARMRDKFLPTHTALTLKHDNPQI
jgi:hypothetical protein